MYHSRIASYDDDFVSETRERIFGGSLESNGFADVEQKRQELMHPFYRFAGDIREDFSSKKHKVDYPVEHPQTPAKVQASDQEKTPHIPRIRRNSLQ